MIGGVAVTAAYRNCGGECDGLMVVGELSGDGEMAEWRRSERRGTDLRVR